jgi:hypothetical protein
LAGRVGGGVPLGEVVQTNEREESEREGKETVSWHRGKMEGGRLHMQSHGKRNPRHEFDINATE